MHVCAPNSCRLYKSTIWHFQEMPVCAMWRSIPCWQEITFLLIWEISICRIQGARLTLCVSCPNYCIFSGIVSCFSFAFCLACMLNRTPKTRSNNGLGSCLHCFILCLLRSQRIKIEVCRFAVNLQVPYRKTNRNLLKNCSDRHLWYILIQWNCEIWEHVCVVKTTSRKG